MCVHRDEGGRRGPSVSGTGDRDRRVSPVLLLLIGPNTHTHMHSQILVLHHDYSRERDRAGRRRWVPQS